MFIYIPSVFTNILIHLYFNGKVRYYQGKTVRLTRKLIPNRMLFCRRIFSLISYKSKLLVLSDTEFIQRNVMLLLILNIFPDRCFIEFYCRHIVPSDQYLFPNLHFKFACLSNIIRALFPFRYPMKPDTLIFGGRNYSHLS